MDRSPSGNRKEPIPPARTHHGQQSHSGVTHLKEGSGKGPVAAPRLSKQSQQQERRNKNIEPLIAKDVAADPQNQRNGSGASGSGNEIPKDRNSLSRQESESVDEYIHFAWTSLNFEVHCPKKKMIKFNATQDIDPPCKLQFALDSKDMEEESKELLVSKGIIYTKEEDKLCFLFKEPVFDWQESEVKKSLIQTLQSGMVNDIDCVSTAVDSLSDKRLREKLKINVPSAIRNGKVMIYKSGNSIHLVGGSRGLKKFCDLICWESTPGGERGEIVLDHLNPNDIRCLKAFEFNKTVSNMVPEIAFQFSDLPRITGSVEQIRKAKSALDDLIKTVVRKHVTFEKPRVALAFINEDGRQNDVLCDWVMKHVLKNKSPKIQKCHIEVWDGEIPKVEVCCCSETEAESAVKVVSQCFGFHEMSRQIYRVNASLIQRFKEEKRLFLLPGDEQHVQVVTTYDISNDFLRKLENVATGTIKSNILVSRLLSNHGANILADVQRKNQVEIELMDDKIIVRGLKTNVDIAKADLRKSLVSQTLPVNVEKELLEESTPKFDEIARECKCICKVKQRGSPDHDIKKVKNGIYYATWFNPINSTKLTVIEGVAGVMDFDALVLPTTDVMYPICSQEHLTNTDLSSVAKEISEKIQSIKKKLAKGDIEYYDTKTHDFGSKEILYFVVSESNNAVEKGFDFITPDICQKFRKSSDGTDNKTIGLPVDMLTENRDITSNGYAHRIASLWKNNWSKSDGFPEIFLCATSSVTARIVQIVSEVFDGSKGFARRSFIQSLDKKSLKNQVQLKVVEGNLHETTADIIVNTTRPDLDLSHGMISVLIDKHAGQSVQTECQAKYPKGLTKCQVAVTGAGNLELAYGIKKIFHIALSREVSRSNYQSVKEFVRTCLYNAEVLETDCKSIAFPALGTGNLGYARRDVAAAMYAAATEFIQEALHPKLKTIFFVLYDKDKKTCQAFANINRRHKIEQEDMSIRTDQQCLKTTVNHGKHQIDLVVGVNLYRPPPSFVELHFSANVSGSTEDLFTTSFKQAIADPETQNDQLCVAVKVPIYERTFETVVRKILICTEDDRITGLLVFPFISSYFQCPVGKQVENIAKSVQSLNSLTYLKEVWFHVDAAGFSNVENTLETAETSTIMSFLQTVRVVESKLIWQPAFLERNQPGTSTSVEIVGLNEETVGLAAQKVAEEIQRIYEKDKSKMTDLNSHTNARTIDKHHMDTYTKQGAIPKKTGRKYPIAEKVQTVKTTNPAADTKSWCEVTAKINQGIIDFLLKYGRLHAWQCEITHRFKIKIETVDRHVSVRGSIETMNEFSCYLANTWQSDSCQRENSMNTDEAKVCIKGMSEKVERSTDLALACVGKEFDSSISSVVDKSVRDTTYEYMIGNVLTKVYKADLTKLNVKCIVSSATPKLAGDLGIAQAIAKAAGTKFTEECKLSVRNSGELKCGKVKVTGAGDLACDSVFHVYVQANTIQRSITDCILEAEYRQFSSVAFPFLGTGLNQLNIEDVAEACRRAVLEFSKERRSPSSIKEVHFVDRESRHISKFTGVIQSYFHSLTLKYTRIIAAKGDVVATKVCACVIPEDKDFSGTGRMSQDVAALSGDNYIEELKELKKARAKVGDVLLTKAREQMTHTCRYVIYAFSPQRSLKYTRSTGQFSADIQMTVKNVLISCEENQIDSVALPMFGQSKSEELFPTPVPTCCSSMVNGIQEFLHTKRNTCIREIQLLGRNEEVAQFIKYLHDVQWK